MSYNYITLSQLRTEIVNKLGDLENNFWTVPMINASIKEALLTFGALANYWKEDVIINSSEDVVYYNLYQDILLDEQLAFIEPTITAQEVLDWINYDLIENVSNSNQEGICFTLTEFISLLNKKANELLGFTELIGDIYSYNIPAPNIDIIEIDNSIIKIIKCVYVDADGNRTILNRVDEEKLERFFSSYNQPNTPRYFSDSLTIDKKRIRLSPPPSNNGILEVIALKGLLRTGDKIEDLAQIINIPNNLIPYLKYGIELEILSKDGIIGDIYRAKYCEQRWKEGLQIANNYPSALTVKINEVGARISDFESIIKFKSNWHTNRVATKVLGFACYNIFIPDSRPILDTEESWKLKVVANAKLLDNDTDYLQVQSEYKETLVDYIFHILQFKCGISDLKKSESFLQNFIQVSLSHNIRLQERGITYSNLLGISNQNNKAYERATNNERATAKTQN